MPSARKSTSRVTPARVQSSRQNRLNPLRGLTATRLVAALEEFQVGGLRQAALIWDAMLRRYSTLSGVSGKRIKSASRCQYEILTVNNTDRAKQHAAALRWTYNNLRTTNAYKPNEQGGVGLLLRQMMSSLGMYHAVHEIVFRPTRGGAIDLELDKDSGATFKLDTLLGLELRFCPLWWFESRNGPLAYLQNDWDYYGEALKDGEWMVTNGDGLMEATAVECLKYSMGIKDLLGFSDKFGQPVVDIAVEGKPGDDVWEDAKQTAADFGNNLSIVRNKDGTVNILETGKGASSLPFPLIMDEAKREIIALWRGGDLGTQSSKDGEGTGASLQGDEASLLTEDDCETILTGTLNEKIDRLVIGYLFNEEPLAYIKVIPPKRLNVAQDLETAEKLSDRGVAVGVNQLRERVGWPAPAKDEPLLGRASAPKPEPNPAAKAALENERAQDSAIVNAVAVDTQPIRAELAAILQISDDTLREVKLRAWLDRIEKLKADLTVGSETQRAIAQIIGTELAAAVGRGRKVSQS